MLNHDIVSFQYVKDSGDVNPRLELALACLMGSSLILWPSHGSAPINSMLRNKSTPIFIFYEGLRPHYVLTSTLCGECSFVGEVSKKQCALQAGFDWIMIGIWFDDYVIGSLLGQFELGFRLLVLLYKRVILPLFGKRFWHRNFGEFLL